MVPDHILARYKKFKAEPITNDLEKNTPYKVIETDLLSPDIVKKEKGDTLKRSLVRHDPDKVVKNCIKAAGLI
jgi:NADH:ubiquinone oxidoreductase subunit D